ncbi:MAG: family 10 glycosylhydrolase, partial [Candidatus Sumerlaeaceae bacterium]|nr:family 10 glycosylhydrolase [Candidatus Sumerlaeaceae bacterium]
MKVRRVAALAALMLGMGFLASARSPEYRVMWVSRFEWPSANEATAKANIDNIMQNLAANGFNAVLFQVRGQCDVHYPSPYEPWASTYGWTDPGWDPLAYAIQAAHSRGLEFHAYINTHTLAQGTPPAYTCL